MSNIKIIAAETHTSEYLLHKYWARKPHNIISFFINDLVPEDGIVVDPFCGSGVVLREAQKLGRSAYGFDINPTAILITKVLIDPPNTKVFIDTVSAIIDRVNFVVRESFTEDGKVIKYCVHSIIAKCSICGEIQKQSEAALKGKRLCCKKCGARLRVNLENLEDTEITGVFYEGQKQLDTSASACSAQKAKSDSEIFSTDHSACAYDFAENRRILAYGGMNTRHLFTRRNFSILSYLSDEFDKIENERVRKAALLLLSASVAQCSRLIANRNNLSTGGPAWSIPGFWVPAIHLETNPLVHLKARLQKFSRGLSELSAVNASCTPTVKKADAREGLKQLSERGIFSDLVFFDPPYGDNVPYVEFSAMWNSFLKDFPNPDDDISVSDRKPKNSAWSHYTDDIESSIAAIRSNLKPNGHLLITFNNNDMRAWKSLLISLQKQNMLCEHVTYQIPAVVSAKAQKSIESSYVGDIYSIYKKSDVSTSTYSLSSVTNALIKCAKFRGGIISKPLAQRTMILAWIENNISAELLDEMDPIRNSLFDEKEGLLYLKEFDTQNPSEFTKAVISVAEQTLKNGPCEWRLLYEKTAAAVADYGVPDPSELKTALTGHVTFDGSRCLAFVEKPIQISFFDLQNL